MTFLEQLIENMEGAVNGYSIISGDPSITPTSVELGTSVDEAMSMFSNPLYTTREGIAEQISKIKGIGQITILQYSNNQFRMEKHTIQN